MKKILTSCLIVLICLTAFISGYSKGCYSYAEDINYMSDEELEAAYQAYLQSKGGSLIGDAGARYAYSTGKMLNFLTSDSNTTPYKNLNEIKGLMSWQKSELESGNSSVLQLAMSQGGASVFSLYTQWLLQNHYFGNGVSENDGMFNDGTNNNLYSGYIFISDEGQYCNCTVVDNRSSSNATHIIAVGTPFIKSGGKDAFEFYASFGWNTSGHEYFNFHKNGSNYSYVLNPAYSSSKRSLYFNSENTSYGYLYSGRNNDSYNPTQLGFPSIITDGQGRFNLGAVSYDAISGNLIGYSVGATISNVNDSSNVTVNFITNNNNNILVFPTINEGDNLYITPKVKVEVDGTVNYQPYTVNEGDNITNIVNNYYQDSGDPDKTITIPSTTPDGGGSGGGNDNPSGGNPPSWNNPFPHLSPDGEGGFNFNFNLPDLNIDWNISGLQEKFPFSIPFDLIHFVQVLNAEPETPEFDWTIDLKIYQWHIDADLHQFDNLAGIVRNVEFIGFCITLVLITRKMIKG